MELYQLRSFAAIAETGQLTRAAEKLHVSQPAVSAQLKALEEELEFSLFDRTPSGMVLTSAGKRLLADADKVLAAVQSMQNHARSLKGEVVGKARIGTLSDPNFIRVGEFIGAATIRHPLIELELHQGVTGELLAKVRDGELDASATRRAQVSAGRGDRAAQIVYRVRRRRRGGAPEGCGLVRNRRPAVGRPPVISTHNLLVHALLREHGVVPPSLSRPTRRRS
jgi:DNA-binding transcriptional LysR family regulator